MTTGTTLLSWYAKSFLGQIMRPVRISTTTTISVERLVWLIAIKCEHVGELDENYRNVLEGGSA